MQIRGPLSVENSLEDLGLNDELWDESGYPIALIPGDRRAFLCNHDCSCQASSTLKIPAASRRSTDPRKSLGSVGKDVFRRPKRYKISNVIGAQGKQQGPRIVLMSRPQDARCCQGAAEFVDCREC